MPRPLERQLTQQFQRLVVPEGVTLAAGATPTLVDLVGAARVRPDRNRRRPRTVGAASPGRPGAAHRLCQRREPVARARRRAAARIGRASGPWRRPGAADAPAPGRKPDAGSHWRRARVVGGSRAGRRHRRPPARERGDTARPARRQPDTRVHHRPGRVGGPAVRPGARAPCGWSRRPGHAQSARPRHYVRPSAAPTPAGRRSDGAVPHRAGRGRLAGTIAGDPATHRSRLRPHAHLVCVGEPVAGRPARQPGRAVRRASKSGTVGDPWRGARGDDWVAAAVGQFGYDRCAPAGPAVP